MVLYGLMIRWNGLRVEVFPIWGTAASAANSGRRGIPSGHHPRRFGCLG